MTTLGLPYYFEDTTGLVCGPTDFLDIYDRPPFLRLSTSHPHPRTPNQSPNLRSEPPEGRTLKIFELGARTFASSRRAHMHDSTPPSAVLALDAGGRGVVGSVRFRGGPAVALERWLKKSMTFGSTLMRQFKASDGMYYQWSFRSVQDYEWACVQLGTNHLVAHYDVKTTLESIYKTSGNVLTLYEPWAHLSVELLASLIVMRHIRASSSH